MDRLSRTSAQDSRPVQVLVLGTRWSWEWKDDGVLVGMEMPPVLDRQVESGLVNVGCVAVGPQPVDF